MHKCLFFPLFTAGVKAKDQELVHKIYPEEIEVIYYTTPRQQLDDYKSATPEQRQGYLSQCRFRKTFPKNPLLRLWTGKLPMNEFEDLILATGIKPDVNGYLTKASRIIASQVAIPHEAINTVEDEKETLAKLQVSNAMFTYARLNYKLAMPCSPTQSCKHATAGDVGKSGQRQPRKKTTSPSRRPNRVLA